MVVIICKWKFFKFLLKFISYCLMKWFDIDIFFQDLNSVFWDCVFIYDDINDIWVIWYKLFIEVIDCYVLFKKKLVCGNVVL